MHETMMRLGITDAAQLTRHRERRDLDWNRIHTILRRQPLMLVRLLQLKVWDGFVVHYEVREVAHHLGIPEDVVLGELERLEAELGTVLQHVFEIEPYFR